METKPPNHALEDVPDLYLEMILVVMSPAKKSGHELVQLRSHQTFWEHMNRQFDEAKSRLDNFAVRRGEEDKKCCHNLVEHIHRDCVYQRILCQWGWLVLQLIMIPLNSKTSLDMAVTVALIMWGVAPARPAAIIVTYSSRLALADLRV